MRLIYRALTICEKRNLQVKSLFHIYGKLVIHIFHGISLFYECEKETVLFVTLSILHAFNYYSTNLQSRVARSVCAACARYGLHYE